MMTIEDELNKNHSQIDSKYHTIITEWTIVKKDEPIYNPSATVVRVRDDSGGCFVEVRQPTVDDADCVLISDSEEWEYLKSAIEHALKVAKEKNEKIGE